MNAPTKAVAVREKGAAPARKSPPPATFLDLIAQLARDPAVNVDTMERVLAMQERLEARTARADFTAALAKLQIALPMIAKRGEIKKKGGGVQSTYAKWEDINRVIKPLLDEHGFSLSFKIGGDGKVVTVTGVLAHIGGHQEETTFTLPMDKSEYRNDVQSLGSSTSYGKRYTAAALLNLVFEDEDDDAEGAGEAEGVVTKAEAARLDALIREAKANRPAFLEHFGIEGTEYLPASRFDEAERLLRQKIANKTQARP